ncbi:uncharacterized protein RHOBADRAFT_53012 [Rhodotorula graminis WP1]|uniref:DUF221-domain-containing protein n=1 Tax=Rhodotorula graminis (strain WP1) TaxID=578459 RepID=A0A194S600_RHOGW|nr:uncharacterized protein RHOBADRAFT_53012 [Rhodotorula graminis WP1]KPV76012.1 hypothetical protein RHOBADRAFT_53012 [Rhodotorula graminis WP1]
MRKSWQSDLAPPAPPRRSTPPPPPWLYRATKARLSSPNLATIDQKTFASTFTGLKSTAITAGCFIAGGLILKETLSRLRRYSDEDARREKGEPTRDRGVEGYAMGYIYRARSYVAGPKTPNYGRPLAWALDAYKLPQSWYETHCGADATLYVRFLGGCFIWMTCLAWTLFPILMSINYLYAKSSFDSDAIDRASLTALVQGTRGLHLLPIHVVAVWIVILSWIANLTWLGHGALRVRRNELRRLIRDDAERHQLSTIGTIDAARPPQPPAPTLDLDPCIPDSEIGWRYRTCLVRNIPPLLRSEQSLREYFERYLRDVPPTAGAGAAAVAAPTSSSSPPDPVEKHEYPPTKNSGGSTPTSPGSAEIVEIVLVRRHTELNQLYFARYREVLHQLETAHVELARAVMRWVRERFERDEALRAGKKPKDRKRAWWKKHVRRQDVEHEAREGDDVLLERLKPFLDSSRSALPSSMTTGATAETLWEALHDLQAHHPSILDRFQPLFRLRYFSAAVPAIDYFLLKHNLLYSLIEDKRAHPEAVEALMANALIWAITIIWVLPISILIGLLSLNSLRDHVPSLANFLVANPVAQSIVTSLLPTALIALLNMYTPTVIGLIQRHGRTIITESKWSRLTQSSYWKFVVINLLVVFTIGTTAFTALLNAFSSPTSVLDVVAGAFPRAGTFFVSYLLLQVGVQNGVETSLLGISWINHASIRKYVAPRKRALENIPRFFGAQTWLPNHLFVISICLIFAVLNPLVLAIGWVYFGFSTIVLKSQFAHVYYRRNFEMNGRVWFRRIFRYSLDICILASFIMVAFFWVLREFACGGACIPLIPIAVAVKILGTRWFDHLMDEVDEACIDAICGEGDPLAELSVPLADDGESAAVRSRRAALSEAFSTVKTFAIVTLPSLALHPSDPLPHPYPRPTSQLAAHRRAQTDRAASLGAARVKQRPRASTAPDDWGRHILDPVVSVDGSTTDESAHGSPQMTSVAMSAQASQVGGGDPAVRAVDYAAAQAVSAEKVPGEKRIPEDERDRKGDVKEHGESATRALVTPHPPIVRDDRPVSHLRYRNPAEVEPLARTLWLPRDPLKPVDLGDTVDYHGRALVSSAGGRGIVGQWDEAETDLGDDDDEGEGSPEKLVMSPASLIYDGDRSPDELKRVGSRLSSMSVGGAGVYTLKGTERVRVAADVAAKAEQEEPAAANLVRAASRRSSIGRRSSVAASPRHSPVLVRHPDAPRPSPPGIPSFTDEPSTMSSAEQAQSSSAYPFPPPVPGPSSPQRDTHLSPNRSLRHRSPSASSTPGSVTTGEGPTSPTSPASPMTTRTARSASVATSMRSARTLGHLRVAAHEAVILEDAAGEDAAGAVSVSQSAAVRSELLEEERRSHLAHRRQEEHRIAQERKDREVAEGTAKGGGSWFRRLLAKQEVEAQDDET